MKHWTALKTSAALALCMTGSVAFADVSAQDVWGAWKEQFGQYGYRIDASEAMSGGTLSLSDLTMQINLPEGEGTIQVAMDGLSFRENGDGTVQVMMPPNMPVRLHIEPKDDKVMDLVINHDTQGLAMIVSGSVEEMTYTYSAASAALSLASLMVEGKPVDMGQVGMTMTNVSGRSTTTKAAIISAKQSFAAETVDYLVDIKDPQGSGEHLFLKGNVTGVQGAGSSSTPEGVDMQDMGAALKAGFGFDMTFNHAGGSNQFEFDGDGQQMQANSSSTGGAFRFAMDAGQLVYDLMSNGVSIDLVGSDIPLPVSFQMAQAGMKLTMPLSASEELQGYQVAVTLGDFTMADMLWGIFDPAGQLPRDPATVAFDVSGKAKLTKDLMDESQMGGMTEQQVPGEIHSATISGLTVRVAGADLTGSGDFTFDNTDLVSFDGMPRPEGALNLKLVGGNGLLDKLVAMGFVPEDQAMGARMMMGLFAVPAEGEDTLTSKIEVNAEGHVLANGQRLK